MTSEDQEKFCGTICLAASRLGFVIHESNPSTLGTQFQWFDPQTSRLIKGQPKLDRKNALQSACESLVSYFTQK